MSDLPDTWRPALPSQAIREDYHYLREVVRVGDERALCLMGSVLEKCRRSPSPHPAGRGGSSSVARTSERFDSPGAAEVSPSPNGRAGVRENGHQRPTSLQ